MADIEAIEPVLLGVDGRPLVPMTEDAIRDFASNPQQTTRDLYLQAGRMLRDGRSIKDIKYECTAGAPGLVTDAEMERFARDGLRILEAAIAQGLVREETVVHVMADPFDIDMDKQDLEDALKFDPTGANNVSPDFLRDD